MTHATTRRTFLKTGTALTAAAAVPWDSGSSDRSLNVLGETESFAQDPQLKRILNDGLAAARSAGAMYADIRFTHNCTRSYSAGATLKSYDRENMTVGVRALVHGYWGFSSGPLGNADEITRLAREAVALAKTNAAGPSRIVVLAPSSHVPDGHWTMPVARDPFTVSREEVWDMLVSLDMYGSRYKSWKSGSSGCGFERIDKAFGSTDGNWCTQRLYRSNGYLNWSSNRSGLWIGLEDYLSPAGKGWELYTDQPLRAAIDQRYAELQEDESFPVLPVEIGRYDAVWDTGTLRTLLNGSIGAATQLDRVMGFEANAGGTSYITDPNEMLGTLMIGSPLLTVTANRHTPGAAATVRWDDEGVVPEECTLVEQGRLTDFSTSREAAGWLHEWPAHQNRPFRSTGCASASQAVNAALVHTPNLVMVPGPQELSFSEMVSGITNGVAIKRGTIWMDFQQRTGMGAGIVFEVKNGKRTARLYGAGFLLQALEFWKSVTGIGGPSSRVRYGMPSTKGEPPVAEYNSVDLVPVATKNLALIEMRRKS